MKKILKLLLLFTFFLNAQIAFAAFEVQTVKPPTEQFAVVNIKQGNSLKMQRWPSLTSKVVVAIPHNAQAITYKGSKVKQGETLWKKVYWNNNEGWVDAKYLQQHKDKTTKVAEQQPTLSPPQTNIQTPTEKPPETTKANTNGKHTILACGGSTPFWNVHIDLTDKTILVNLQDGKAFTTSLNSRKWDTNKNEMLITGGEDERVLKAILNKTNTCTDHLTTLKYPFTANLTIGESKKISGCCRTIQK